MMISPNKEFATRLRNRRGAMLVFVAISMVALLGMLTLTLDVGAGNRQRRIAQTAADAGAIGGGTQILRGLDSASVVTAADSSIVLNGFAVSDAIVRYPPAVGPHAGDKQYVQVDITKTIPSIFGSLFNKDSLTATARAIAGVSGVTTNCLVSLKPSGLGMDLNGNVTANCGVVSNSTGNPAIDIANGKDIVAPFVASAGTISGSVQGTSSQNAPPIVDPLANLAVPTDTVCTYKTQVVVSGTQTLNPGVFCGGILIGKNDLANLNPGTYFIRGGGISGGHIAGTGVTLILSNGPGNNQATYGPLTFPQACSMSLTAPTTGPYAGIVIFGDRAGPTSGSNSFNDVCGKGNNDITGTIYFPVQTLNLGNGNGKLTMTGDIIAASISQTNGGADLILNSPSASGAGPKRLSLVQ